MSTAVSIEENSAPLATQFQAKWPKSLDPALKSTCSKIMRIFWNILSIIIFPIGLCRLAYWSLRNYVFSWIVPGHPFDGDFLIEKHNGHPITLTAPDGAKLESAFFPGKNRKKAIIYAFGNAMRWEVCENSLELLKPLNTSILIVNPRGVGKSTGDRNEEGYALDIYTAYEYLIHKEGLDPEDILLVGFSMGGAYGACGASLIQEKYSDKKISAISLSSFSDLNKEINALIRKYLGCLLFYPATLAVKAMGFALNAQKAWDTLKGKKCIFFDPTDPIILKEASQFEAVQKNPKGSPTTLVNMHHKFDHCRDFYVDEANCFYEQVMEMLHITRAETDLQELKISRKDFVEGIPKDYPFENLASQAYPTKKILQNHIKRAFWEQIPDFTAEPLEVRTVSPVKLSEAG